MPRSRLVLLGALALLLAPLAGCSRGGPPPPPKPLDITVVGTEDLNGGGNAAVVRIYALGGDAAFQRAPVQAFWQDDAAALGAELVAPAREVTLFPGATETVSLALDERAQFVGFAADLREPAADGWRALHRVEALRGQRILVTVGEDALSVETGAP